MIFWLNALQIHVDFEMTLQRPAVWTSIWFGIKKGNSTAFMFDNLGPTNYLSLLFWKPFSVRCSTLHIRDMWKLLYVYYSIFSAEIGTPKSDSCLFPWFPSNFYQKDQAAALSHNESGCKEVWKAKCVQKIRIIPEKWQPSFFYPFRTSLRCEKYFRLTIVCTVEIWETLISRSSKSSYLASWDVIFVLSTLLGWLDEMWRRVLSTQFLHFQWYSSAPKPVPTCSQLSLCHLYHSFCMSHCRKKNKNEGLSLRSMRESH